MPFPLLTSIIFLPLFGGLLILFTPKDRTGTIKAIATAATGLALILAAADAFTAMTAPPPYRAAKAPKAESGPSAAERAANRAAFDKKQALAKQRLADREVERAKAASHPASAPRALPLPSAVGQ